MKTNECRRIFTRISIFNQKKWTRLVILLLWLIIVIMAVHSSDDIKRFIFTRQVEKIPVKPVTEIIHPAQINKHVNNQTKQRPLPRKRPSSRFPVINLPRRIGCTERKHGNITLSRQRLPLTALASPFRSGNTWLRHLLQMATGLGTSAVYCDPTLQKTGFPYECSHEHFDRAIVVKTHESTARKDDDIKKDNHTKTALFPKFDRAVLVIRDPYTFIVANNHINHLDIGKEDSYFQGRWFRMRPLLLDWWNNFNNYWLLKFQGPVYPVLYSNLLNDTETELRNILKFLRVSYTDADIKCTIENKEGNFHRKKFVWTRIRDVTELFDESLKEKVDSSVDFVSKILRIRYEVEWVDETHAVKNNLTKCDICNDSDTRDTQRR